MQPNLRECTRTDLHVHNGNCCDYGSMSQRGLDNAKVREERKRQRERETCERIGASLARIATQDMSKASGLYDDIVQGRSLTREEIDAYQERFGGGRPSIFQNWPSDVVARQRPEESKMIVEFRLILCEKMHLERRRCTGKTRETIRPESPCSTCALLGYTVKLVRAITSGGKK
jgi:hypothetical protein